MKVTVNMEESDILDMYAELPIETKYRILETFMFEDILKIAEEQLKGDTDFYSWDTSGWRHGSNLREAIAKIQGIGEEMRKDRDALIKSITRDRDYYKKYRDKYYEIYHYQDEVGYNFLKRTVGLI